MVLTEKLCEPSSLTCDVGIGQSFVIMNDEFPFCEVSEAGKQACQASVIVGKIEICSAIDNFVSQCKLVLQQSTR